MAKRGGISDLLGLKRADGSYDKSAIGKWACVGGAALLGLVASLFDEKAKDNRYADEVTKAVAKRLEGQK